MSKSVAPKSGACDRRVSETRPRARETRGNQRVDVALEVEIEHGGRSWSCTSKNVSLGGVFVETTELAPFGATVTIVIPLPGLRARVEAFVRWTSAEGMGLQFAPMGARETHALTQLLAHP